MKITTGKNLLENVKPIGLVQTIAGVTFTVNKDKSVTINGTSTSDMCDFYVTSDGFSSVNLVIPPGSYKTNSKPHPGISFHAGSGTSLPINAGVAWAFIRVYKGTTVNNVTVYPMITLASETDDSYEPYTGGFKVTGVRNEWFTVGKTYDDTVYPMVCEFSN